jgi:HK97 family phage portal protein
MKSRKPARRKSVQTKALTFMPAVSGWEFFNGKLPGSDINYAEAVKNGMHSSVVTSALCWMMRTFPEAPIVVQRLKEEKWEVQAQHDMALLLEQPNPYYSGIVLLQATIMDFCFGEAFWLKIRNGEGQLVELWWAPRALIKPMPDSKTGLLSYYQYNPGLGASPKDLSPDDVVHFRFGFDPNNILRGFSPLAAVMREVYTDDQAANFTAAILKNLGIIGIVLSPKQGSIPKGDLPALKDDIQQKFTGDKRGSALIMGGPMDAQVLQYNLTGFDISPVRDIAEERVTAALGIPAAVIGFGTGLQQTKVGATMREMVKLAWQGGIEPNQRSIAAELNRSVLPEFQDNAKIFRSLFDNSQVEALTETPSERTDRVLKLVETNIIKVTQAQRELGYPVDESQNKYMRELQPTPVKPPTLPALPAEPGNRVGDNLPAEN